MFFAPGMQFVILNLLNSVISDNGVGLEEFPVIFSLTNYRIWILYFCLVMRLINLANLVLSFLFVFSILISFEFLVLFGLCKSCSLGRCPQVVMANLLWLNHMLLN